MYKKLFHKILATITPTRNGCSPFISETIEPQEVRGLTQGDKVNEQQGLDPLLLPIESPSGGGRCLMREFLEPEAVSQELRASRHSEVLACPGPFPMGHEDKEHNVLSNFTLLLYPPQPHPDLQPLPLCRGWR